MPWKQAGYDVTGFDAAAGGQRWRAHVAEPTQDYDFAIVSADPVVIDDPIPGTRQSGHVRTFGPGRPPGIVDPGQ